LLRVATALLVVIFSKQTSKRRKQNGKHKGVVYEDTSDVSEGEGDDGRPLWRMELKDGPALTSGLGLPQNQIMDSGIPKVKPKLEEGMGASWDPTTYPTVTPCPKCGCGVKQDGALMGPK